MIRPFGSETLNPLYVADDAERAALEKEAEGLPSLLLNSAAALVVAGHADTLRQGAEKAAESIDSGAARTKIEELAKITSEAA